MYVIKNYVDLMENDFFEDWLDSLQGQQVQARIAARLVGLKNGNFGDCKPISEGIWELKVDWRPDY